MSTLHITEDIVRKLIAKQFPQWSDLPITKIVPGGHDNRTFRLGESMLIRLPSAQAYAEKVIIEQTWLPRLAPDLPCAIPKPLAMGNPSNEYPYHWSVYEWIEGKSANVAEHIDMNTVAKQLADFLQKLHAIDTTNAPGPGAHNFYRGAHPSVYDAQTHDYIKKLKHCIDSRKALSVWQTALESEWSRHPVWLHGDLSNGNILIQNKQLSAVIDFGGMAVGDPACDLTIAWTFFDNESRTIFKSNINLDNATWARARSWALWKACFELVQMDEATQHETAKQITIINTIIAEHKNN